MRKFAAISVFFLVSAGAQAEHASSRANFRAPESTMSGTSQGSANNRPQGSFSLGNMGGGGGSPRGAAYKPNESLQKQMSEAGQKSAQGISKLGEQATTQTTALTDNFLKQVNGITSQRTEDFGALKPLSASIGTTEGMGQTAGSANALLQESQQLVKTQENILLQQLNAARQTQAPVAPPPPAQAPTVIERINAAINNGRPPSPTSGGSPLNYVPRGYEGETTSLSAIPGRR